jgi:hypothetical protein
VGEFRRQLEYKCLWHPEAPDRALAEFAHGADLLYTEGQYTANEYASLVGVSGDAPLTRRGWGHSPIEAAQGRPPRG